MKRNKNFYEFYKNYVVGYASNANVKFYIDIEDFDKVKLYYWHYNKKGYIVSSTFLDNKRGTLYLHKLILNNQNGTVINHKNRNKLDCRKLNLRLATTKENNINKNKRKENNNGYIGIRQNKNLTKITWSGYITVNEKYINLGTYDKLEDAIIARLKAELKYFGKNFAPQRHLFKEYGINY